MGFNTNQDKGPENCGQHLMKRLLIQKKVICLLRVYLSHYKLFLRNDLKREKQCLRRDIKGLSQVKRGKLGTW